MLTLGMTMPTRGWPGIGVSMLIVVAASASARSFSSALIRRTGTPAPGSSANCVTAAPGLISRTRASTLKAASVSSMRCALRSSSSRFGSTES